MIEPRHLPLGDEIVFRDDEIKALEIALDHLFEIGPGDGGWLAREVLTRN